MMRLIAGVCALIAIAAVGGGIALLVHGHLSGLPTVLMAFGMAAFLAGFNVAGARSLERDIPKLVEEMNGILDSTATLTSVSIP
jgi:hypothetical protein